MKQYIINTSDRVKEVNINGKNFRIRILSIGEVKKLMKINKEGIEEIDTVLKIIVNSFVNFEELLKHLNCDGSECFSIAQVEKLVEIIAEVNKDE